MSLHHAFYINQAKWQHTNKHPKHQYKKKHQATLSQKIQPSEATNIKTLAIFFRHFRLQLRCPKFCLKSPGKWRNSAVKITALLYRFEPKYLWPMPLQATAAFLLMEFLRVFFHARPASTNRPLNPKSNLTGCYRQGDPSADGWEEATLAYSWYEKQLWWCWILVQIINEKRFIDKHRERERESKSSRNHA